MALSGKTAAVTGAGSGIGRAIAEALADKGARIGIFDLDIDAAAAVADELRVKGHDARAYLLDVTVSAMAAEVLDAFARTVDGIDILVNNAGTLLNKPFLETTDEEWRRLFAVHVDGAFHCCRAVIPGMKAKGWGRIINISSQLAHLGGANLVGYSAAKAGLTGFTRALAREVIGHGITVNSINPGPIDTALTSAHPGGHVERLIAELPIGRLGRVEEVSATAVLLASEEGGFYVGASLNMNGGHYMI